MSLHRSTALLRLTGTSGASRVSRAGRPLAGRWTATINLQRGISTNCRVHYSELGLLRLKFERIMNCVAAQSVVACRQPHISGLGARTRCALPVRRAPRTARAGLRRGAVAMLGGRGDDDNDEKPKLTREKEPKEYWKSEAEKSGKSPFQARPLLVSIQYFFRNTFIKRTQRN